MLFPSFSPSLTGQFGFLWMIPLTTRSQTSAPCFRNIHAYHYAFNTPTGFFCQAPTRCTRVTEHVTESTILKIVSIDAICGTELNNLVQLDGENCKDSSFVASTSSYALNGIYTTDSWFPVWNRESISLTSNQKTSSLDDHADKVTDWKTKTWPAIAANFEDKN